MYVFHCHVYIEVGIYLSTGLKTNVFSQCSGIVLCYTVVSSYAKRERHGWRFQLLFPISHGLVSIPLSEGVLTNHGQLFYGFFPHP